MSSLLDCVLVEKKMGASGAPQLLRMKLRQPAIFDVAKLAKYAKLEA